MSQTCVVLLPGLLCDETVWQRQRSALAPANCFIPSYGTASSIGDMARGVLAGVPSERFSLAGHSMGGRVALEIMRTAPERVERLALLDTGIDPLPDREAGIRERDQRMALLQIAREQGMRKMGEKWARGMVHEDHVDTPVFAEILEMIGRCTPALFAAQIQALLDRPDAAPVLSALRCSTLILCGRQDAWSPPARHERMHEMRPGSRLVVIEDSGHMSTMEQPAAVSQALIEWLSR
ncbi:Pimeloyl-ACP methyl ester carboxylesterase [Variovorax sp. HW608]|uniref:alpha/beta fold hydrolase n=1 Tax=Variovorax sp. HW608 TaxID=1034889 RepID=UPI00081FFFA0|nr:alpha/beta hydrolase [Variovorax sp. HW608]SCK25010.1 Pimeloyl-ACP methyl ester carboxylesterase [Variovorax sp. HW608]